MKKELKCKVSNGILKLMMVFSILLCLGGSVLAACDKEIIEVLYSNIRVMVFGEEVNLVDGNGQKVEPFIYNGVVYIPAVQSLADSFDTTVNWDSKEKSISFGSKINKNTGLGNWMDICPAYQTTRVDTYREDLNQYFSMGGKKYTNGYVFNDRYTGAPEALFNLGGAFDKITLKFGHIDGTDNSNVKLFIFVDGIKQFEEVIGYADLPHTIEIPLDGALQLRIFTNVVAGNTVYGISDVVLE